MVFRVYVEVCFLSVMRQINKYVGRLKLYCRRGCVIPLRRRDARHDIVFCPQCAVFAGIFRPFPASFHPDIYLQNHYFIILM